MPYCKRCRMRCEVTNIADTPSRLIRQGNCTRCNELIYFFMPVGYTRGGDTRVTSTPAHTGSPSRPRPRARAHFSRPAHKPLNPSILYGVGAVLLLIALGLIVARWMMTRFPATVQSNATCLSITNLSDTDWRNVTLTLNDTYFCNFHNATRPLAIRAHETHTLVYSYFMTAKGEMYNPVVPPAHLRIEANSGTDHAVLGTVAIQRMDGN